MAGKKKPVGKDTPIVELIVRRGALRRFDKLKQITTTMPVKVSWDRRMADERSASKEGQQKPLDNDRRQKPPFTWDAADFVVLETPRGEPRRSKKRST